MQLNRRGFLAGLAAFTAGFALPFAKFRRPDISKIEMYDVAGTTAFPLYGCYGGVTSVMCMFPMIRRGNDFVVFRHDFYLFERVTRGAPGTEDERLLQMEQEAKQAFATALQTQKADAWLQLEDGCEFPETGHVAVIRRRKDVQYG